MTRNQIEYWKLKENQRANLTQESLTQRRDEASIAAREFEIHETQRHNMVVESQAEKDLGIKEYSAQSGRMTAEANVRNAESNSRNADTNAYNARINAFNAQTNARNAAINQYAAETGRLAQIESARHNLVGERQQAQSLQIQRGELGVNRQRANTYSSLSGAQAGYYAQQTANMAAEYPYIGAQAIGGVARDFGAALNQGASGLSTIIQLIQGKGNSYGSQKSKIFHIFE